MDSAIDLTKYKFMDPDELKGRSDDAISTIFVDGKLVVDTQPGRAHRSLFNRGTSKGAQWLRKRLAPEMVADPRTGDDGWFDLYGKYLFGRVANITDQETGEIKRFASFWGRGADFDNPQARGPVDQIPACIQALYYKDLVDDDTIVVYGDGRVALAGALLAGSGPVGDIDQAAVEKTELAKRMHLARGNEKQAIMKQLGVGGGGKKNAWDQSLTDKGLMAPGHEHWRMHSEGYDRTSLADAKTYRAIREGFIQGKSSDQVARESGINTLFVKQCYKQLERVQGTFPARLDESLKRL